MTQHGCTKASIVGYYERGRSDGRNLGAGRASHHHGWTVVVSPPPVHVFPFAAIRFPVVLPILLSFCNDKSLIILSHRETF